MDQQWQVVDLVPYDDTRINVVAAIKVLQIPGKAPRYQIHLGRLNREGGFSVGLAVVPELDLSAFVAIVTRRAEHRVAELKQAHRAP